jgi:hypothetical protein
VSGLSAQAEALLPAADENPRCANYARSIELDPGGSAIGADALVLVDLPGPWPKPVFAHEALSGLSSMMSIAAGQARVLATQVGSDRPPGATVYWRVGAATYEGVAAGSPQEVMAKLAHEMPEGSLCQPVLLICTQGSHDVCCGTEGTRLVIELEQGGLDVRIHRVSHTGGHRFAPTAMTLPDGRMWAGVDAELVEMVMKRKGDHLAAARCCRGSWVATRGPAQVAERAIFELEGWDFDKRDRRVTALEDTPGVFEVTADDDRWTVRVEIARDVPTITCRAAGGLPAKPDVEYRVVSIQRS